MTTRCQVLRSEQEIEQIAAAWDALAEQTAHPLNHAAWHRHAARCVHPSTDRLNIIAVWRGEALVALAPLILARGPRGLRYEIIGSRVLYEPAAILAQDAAAAEVIAARIGALDHPVTLARLPAHGDVSAALLQRMRQRGVTLSARASGSSWADLSPGWEAYHHGLPSKLKDMVQRGERQLRKLGSLEFETHRPGPAQAGELLEQAFEVEIRSWKRGAGSAILLREDLHRFFMAYGTELAARGELLVSMLRFGGRPIAMQIANVSHQACWLLKIGYDAELSKYRVGLQLQMASIRWCCEQGLTRYEFLGTEEAWIRDWTDKVHEYATRMLYPYTGRGLLGLARDGIDRVRQRLVAARSSQ